MKIVIFDMDGTLLDSKKDITISINHIRKVHHSLEPLSEEEVVDAINMDVRNLPKLFYNTEFYHEKDRDVFELHYANQCTKNVYLYDGIYETLKELYLRGVRLSVATNAPTPFVLMMLKKLNVDSLFDVIIGADKVKAAKPNPEMLEKILTHYNFDKEKDSAWMIGDNSKDMQSAKNANIDSMFAKWGFSPDGEHHTLLNHPKEILETVL